MALGTNDTHARNVLYRLKKQMVRADEVQVGDIVASDFPYEVYHIDRRPHTPSAADTAMWVGVTEWICLSDVDRNGGGGPPSMMVRIVDRSLLLPFEPDEPDEELEEE